MSHPQNPREEDPLAARMSSPRAEDDDARVAAAAQADAKGRSTSASSAVRDAAAADASAVEVDLHAPRAQDIDPRQTVRNERMVAFTFFAAALAAILFTVAFFAIDPGSPYYTPMLGLTMGVMLFGLGAGPVLYIKRLVPEDQLHGVQERHPFHSPTSENEAFKGQFGAETSKLGLGAGRRTLIKASVASVGAVAALPAVVPLLSLGDTEGKEEELGLTAFNRGVRLVEPTTGRPVKLGDLELGGIFTVQPEGDLRSADAPAILIRMRPGENQPVAGRENFEYEGHVAYSAICTHAGCPVKLYEQQTHHLLCPCHQSTFLATEGCRPIFGPAARRLPQLPISVDEEGFFIALGDFSDPTGPSYWERD